MASARCVYCDATLQPNSAYCVECGQLIPQQHAAPAAPAAVAAPTPAPAASVPTASSAGVAAVPLPGTLPWQQGGAVPVATVPPAVLESVELVFATGERHRVSGAAVIGRKPADTAHTLGARAIEVQDDTLSVSRVHLYLAVEGGRVLVTDAGSANGSRVQRGAHILPLPGEPERTPVVPGDVVWIGDVSFQIAE